MNFNQVVSLKNYFNTLNEAIQFRTTLWEKNITNLELLEQELFDNFDIEDSIFIINEFFNKNNFSLDVIDVLLEVTKSQFENMIDEQTIQKFNNDGTCYHIYIKDEDRFYTFNDNFFKEGTIDLDIKKIYNGF